MYICDVEGINDRIKQVILKENLTASLFADKIGVLRSSLSHILAGRNKPGADFIEKLLQHMPYINANWLFTGMGEPYLEEVFRGQSKSVVQAENTVKESGAQLDILQQLAEMFPEEYSVPEKAVETPVQEFPVKPVNQSINTPERKLVKIIMVYSDATFEELKPGV